MKFGTRFAMPRRRRETPTPRGPELLRHFRQRPTGRARSVVAATGVQYRRPPLARLADFEGAGIYYAATEIEARHCRDAEVVIIGGAKLGRASRDVSQPLQPATCGC